MPRTGEGRRRAAPDVHQVAADLMDVLLSNTATAGLSVPHGRECQPMDPMTVFEQFVVDMIDHTTGQDTFTPLGSGNATLGLYNTPIVITSETPLSTFQSASMTFHGYSPTALSWEAASLNEAGAPESIGNTHQFRPTDSVVDEQAYGVYCWNAHGLCFAGPFVNGPYPMATALNQVTVTPRFQPVAQVVTTEIT